MNKSRIEIVDPQMAQVIASQSPAERLQTAWGMWRSAQRMLTRLIRADNQDWSQAQIKREVARRLASGS